MSIQEGDIDIGEFHGHPIRLLKAGDSTKLHQHDFDHMLEPIEGRGNVYAILPDGEEFIAPVGPRDVRLIRAGTPHRIEALTDNFRFMCWFSRWGKDGYRANPKQWTGNPRSAVDG